MVSESQIKILNKLIFKQKLAKADAVVWLQGDRFDRGPKTLQMYENGRAPKIVISGNDILIGTEKIGKSMRPGEDNVSLEEMNRWLLKGGVKRKDIIIDRRSFNTHDQALSVISLAKRQKWKSLIIVGSWPYYQFRVFLTFLKIAKQLKWNGKIINQFFVLKSSQRPGGRRQTVRQLQRDETAKLIKYREHLATVAQAINYLKP